MKTKYLIMLLTLLMMMLLIGCQNKQETQIKNGEFPLQPNNSIVSLTGKWNFYPNELLSPNDLSLNENYALEKISVPGFWDNNIKYGTYHLRLHLPKESIGTQQALKIPQIFSAYNLWINEDLIIKNGKVAKTKEATIPRGVPETIYFTVSQPNIDIILQVSNFYHRNAGITDPIYIGKPSQIDKHNNQIFIIDWFSIGALIIIGLMHITIYYYRRVEKVFLYFGLFCLVIGLRMLFIGEVYIYQLIPTIHWELVQKLNYIFAFMSFPLLVKYVGLLYPNIHWKDRFFQIVSLISIICILFISFVSGDLYTNTTYIMHVLMLLVIPYFLLNIYKAIINREVGSKIVGIFLVVLLGTAINDFLYDEQVIQTMILIPIGLVLYCGAQAYVLSIKYSHVSLLVQSLNEELESTQNDVMFTLGQIIEQRSNETGNHVRRVAEYSKLLALKYGLSSKEVEKIKLASVMHDVGKIGIADSILEKPGKLTQEEFELIKTHTTTGYNLLKHSQRELMKTAATIAYTHHERFDGTGYPRGLKGEDIPLYGRIVSIADVFDALSSERVYKKAWEISKVISFFKEKKGEQFDPILVDIFLENIDEFLEIMSTYKD